MIAAEVVFDGKYIEHTACARVVWDLTETAVSTSIFIWIVMLTRAFPSPPYKVAAEVFFFVQK